jgi:resuscitation-promoting factor RpfB
MKEWSRLKKTVVISAVTILGLGAIGSASHPQQNTQVTEPSSGSSATTINPPKVQADTTQTQVPTQSTPATSTPAQDAETSTPTDTSPDNCPNGTYVNTDGITVCSPYSASTAPAGATAQCVDGTYSFSLHRSGTCSHHGGVSTWL